MVLRALGNDRLPDVQWQRIVSGEGVAVQRGSQIIVAPIGHWHRLTDDSA
ncbi:MAG: hypothetical protein HQ455_02070 [Burkholderiales bacterium]|nr:hypothetical protein [Burkholderiales bacterium]